MIDYAKLEQWVLARLALIDKDLEKAVKKASKLRGGRSLAELKKRCGKK